MLFFVCEFWREILQTTSNGIETGSNGTNISVFDQPGVTMTDGREAQSVVKTTVCQWPDEQLVMTVNASWRAENWYSGGDTERDVVLQPAEILKNLTGCLTW